jgi:hypothetical protein
MGKAAKEHRKKVAKRNANLKQREKIIQKVWQETFEEKMKEMKEKFASMSGDSMSGLTEIIDNAVEEIIQEESEPTEPVSGE